MRRKLQEYEIITAIVQITRMWEGYKTIFWLFIQNSADVVLLCC